MKKLIRPFAMFACLTAASAVGAQIAAADVGSGMDKQTVQGDKQGKKGPHGERGHRGHRGAFFNKLAKELGLSDQQKSQAKAILEKSRADNKPYFVAMMNEKHQMRKLILSGTADESAIRAQSAKVAAAQSDLAVLKAKEAKQLLALLTPEQVIKLNSILDQREQRFRDRFMSGEEGSLR